MVDHQSLMKQFKLVEEQLEADKLELPATRWKQDMEDFTDLLSCSGQYGETLVEGVLAPKSGGPLVIHQPPAGENERVARKLFNDSRKMLDGETWGHVAEDQVNWFSALARTVVLEAREEEG
jgi:hypothetical protein